MTQNYWNLLVLSTHDTFTWHGTFGEALPNMILGDLYKTHTENITLTFPERKKLPILDIQTIFFSRFFYIQFSYYILNKFSHTKCWVRTETNNDTASLDVSFYYETRDRLVRSAHRQPLPVTDGTQCGAIYIKYCYFIFCTIMILQLFLDNENNMFKMSYIDYIIFHTVFHRELHFIVLFSRIILSPPV